MTGRLHACHALRQVVLAGGTVMLPSFRRRLVQHCQWLCQHVTRYHVLRRLVSERMRIADPGFPAMNLPFIGASILGAASQSSRLAGISSSSRPGAITLRDLELRRPLPDPLFCPQASLSTSR